MKEGKAILRRYGIDPIGGPENPVPPQRATGQHGAPALRHVVDQLKARELEGGTRADIVDMLEKLGKIAARRR